MNEPRIIWRFCLGSLTLWRLVHLRAGLFAAEDAPWPLMSRLHPHPGRSLFGCCMDSFHCLSLWFSLPIAVLLSDGWLGLFLYLQALSGIACLFERINPGPLADQPSLGSPYEHRKGDASCAVVNLEAQ